MRCCASLSATRPPCWPTDRVNVARTRFGATLETWVYAELLKLLESASRELIGIEVKAAASVQASDFKGLRRLREVAGKPFVTGIVLYDGRQALSFGDGFWAVPLNRL